jgi:hypothetical protein
MFVCFLSPQEIQLQDHRVSGKRQNTAATIHPPFGTNEYFRFFRPRVLTVDTLSRTPVACGQTLYSEAAYLSRPMQGSHIRHAEPIPGWVLESGGP